MSNMTRGAMRRLLASPLPVATMIVTGALITGGCTTSSETRTAKPAAHTSAVQSHDGSSLQFLADSMAAQGKYDAAIPLYRRAHALHPKDAGPLLGLGTSLAALGANAEALEALQAAHDRDESDPEITVKLADLYVAMDRPELALTLYSEALVKDPGNAAALNGKAVALDATGDHQTAQNTYETGLASEPENLKLQSNLGLSLAIDGKADESIQMLEDAATDPRAGPSERQNLALAYGLAGRDEDAAKVASIDFDPVTVDENLAYYSELRSMSPDERATALTNGTRKPKQNTDHPANFAYGTDEVQAKATINRLVGSPSAAIEPLEPEAKVEPAVQTAPITEVPPPLGAEGYALQIAAYRKAEQLITGWNILHERYSDIIGTLTARRSEVDFGQRDTDPNGFFYRLNAGPLTTYDEAKALCDEIIARGGPCWVRSPEPSEGQLPQGKPAMATRQASTEPSAKASMGPSAEPAQQAATGTTKPTLDVDALVKDEAAKPKQSATVWEPVGSSEPTGGDQGNAAQTPDGSSSEGPGTVGQPPESNPDSPGRPSGVN